MRKPIIIVGLGGLALSLAACDVRREGELDGAVTEEADTPADTPTAAPTVATSPSASILRQDGDDNSLPELVRPAEPVDLTIPFPDGPEISAAAERQLEALLDEDALDEDWPVILSGHTDSGGNDQANLRASRSRAEAVAAWLVERGVADERIEVIAFGEQNPVAPNALPDGTPNETGRRTNRRVEVHIAPPPVEDNRRGFDQGA